jgi:uncharacterized membrane protein YdjX (TVP38/TMEM64 family)
MRIVLPLGLLLGIAVAFLFLPIQNGLIQLDSYVQSLGALGPAVAVLAYVLCTVLFVPGSAITLGVATLFGLKTAFIVVLIGANGGALCSFLLARTFLREKVARWADGNPKFRSFDHAIGLQGFKIVVLARLSPIFPFNTLNYLLGVTPVKTGAYVIANLLGMLPGMILYVYIGAAARDALTGRIVPSAGLFQQALKYAGLLATVAVVLIITQAARKALREAQQNPQSGVASQRLGSSHPAATGWRKNEPHP